MIKLVAYPLTTIYFICFGLTLLVFHPIQWICFNVFGYTAHKQSVDYLNFFLVRCLHLIGVRYSFINKYKIPTNKPVIIVTNHQSMNDIPPIIWFMRKHHPKFISKKELGKGIPSVSYNLRHGGSVLIDRKQAITSIKAIEAFAKRVKEAELKGEGTSFYQLEEAAYKAKSEEIKTVLNELVNNAVGIPAEFKEKEARNLQYTHLSYLNRYERYHGHYAKKEGFKVSEG